VHSADQASLQFARLLRPDPASVGRYHKSAVHSNWIELPGRVPVAQPGYDRKISLREPRIMTRAVHILYTVEQDEDGIWCAHAQLRPGVGANGEGDTREAAIADLREALEGLIAEFGAPDELTLTIDVA
jgi:predicted RNase H-like HicB family nuclease